jgi:hypothetical protein
MTHIAIQERLDGKTVDWVVHVSDEQLPFGWKDAAVADPTMARGRSHIMRQRRRCVTIDLLPVRIRNVRPVIPSVL